MTRTATKAKGKAKATPATADKEKENSLPTWPPLAPHHHDDLELVTVLQDQILTIPNFFSSKDCAIWTNFLSSSPSISLTSTPPPRKGEALRMNDRFSVTDQDFADLLWSSTALSRLSTDHLTPSSNRPHAKAKGLNPNIRIYRYAPGNLFNPHYDDSVSDPANRSLRSEWMLLIYLSGAEDGVAGGETVFYPTGLDLSSNKRKRTAKDPGPEAGVGGEDTRRAKDEISVPLSRGTALLHKHGSDCLLHEGREVKSGTKWVLRSDVMFSD